MSEKLGLRNQEKKNELWSHWLYDIACWKQTYHNNNWIKHSRTLGIICYVTMLWALDDALITRKLCENINQKRNSQWIQNARGEYANEMYAQNLHMHRIYINEMRFSLCTIKNTKKKSKIIIFFKYLDLKIVK